MLRGNSRPPIRTAEAHLDSMLNEIHLSTPASSFRLPKSGHWFMSRERGSKGLVWDKAVVRAIRRECRVSNKVAIRAASEICWQRANFHGSDFAGIKNQAEITAASPVTKNAAPGLLSTTLIRQSISDCHSNKEHVRQRAIRHSPEFGVVRRQTCVFANLRQAAKARKRQGRCSPKPFRSNG